MESGQTYADIVWKQFRSNRLAYWSLWCLVPLVTTAVVAPVIGSNQPFVFYEEGKPLYPWWHALFNTAEIVDYVFNMVLLSVLPWLVLLIFQNFRWAKLAVKWRTRSAIAVAELALMTIVACGLFAIPALRPDDRFAARTFAADELDSPSTMRGVFAPIPFGPVEQDLRSIYKEPMYRSPHDDWKESNDGFPHVLGTDNVGRDVLVRMIYGTRIAITIGIVAVGIYLTIGCIVGAVAAYFGGGVDMLISRVIEVIMLFPTFFLILTIVGLVGPSIYLIMIVIGFTSWPGIARLIRGEVLKQRAADYVSAAKALGFSDRRIILRHILPNSLSPAFVAAPFGVAGAIITEAGLSLLGFGVQPPAPTWGFLLKLGKDNYTYWWLVVIPSLAIFFTVTVFNLIGNGLRDAMDPRLRSSR